MKVLSIPFLCALTIFAIQGCDNTNGDGFSKISIRKATQHNAAVIVSIFNNLEPTTLVESKTDSMGNCSFKIPTQGPMYVSIQIGEKYGEVYLEPGYELTINENGRDYKAPLRFSGHGAETNNHISWVNSNVERIRWTNGRGIPELDMPGFLHRLDSMKTTINNFHKQYIDTVKLPGEAIARLEFKNRLKFLNVEQEYKFFALNNANNEFWEARKNGRPYERRLPDGLENLAREIPFDTTLIAEGWFDYQMLLNLYWQSEIQIPTSERLGSNSSYYMMPLMTDSLIERGNYPKGIREFLHAFDVAYWLSASGITPEIEIVFGGFKKTYKNSRYLPVLNRRYDEWLALGPGKPAPDLEGYTIQGKKVSIKDLKGKIVYIDVWATWCGPCREEIPFSKKLQQEFSGEETVQFLNVSVDSRRSDWEQFLQKDKTWNGLHIIIDPEKIQSLYTTYKLFGVPDYILIDQAGNIVNMKAPPPSDEKVRSEIEKLLAKDI
jgi:thiol-disulfide isomerase/thioredoxin